MKSTIAAIVIGSALLLGCAEFKAFRATEAGQAAIDQAVDSATATATALVPPPWNMVVPLIGGVAGALLKGPTKKKEQPAA